MGKLTKPLLIIAAIAVNVIPGVGQAISAGIGISLASAGAIVAAVTTAGISAGLGLAASALGLGPKSPAVSPSSRNRLYATIDPATPRKIVFGRTATAADIRYQEWNGSNQEYRDDIICLASHTVTSVEEVWFDDKLAWSGGAAQGEFAGYLSIDVVLAGTAGNYVTIGDGSKWGASRRMTGLAYLRVRFKVTGNDKKAESPFAQSIPARFTIIGKAMPVYDPRFDSTRGGSGPHRADDQTTWAYATSGVESGRNPACQLLTYLLGWRINGKLAVGRGIPPSRFDFDSWITAANGCDEPITLVAGGTEPRYRSDGIFSESDDPRSVIDAFEATMNAKLRDAGGRFALTVISNDLGTPRFAFDDSDVLGDFRWTPTADIDRSFNEVRGRYTNPSTAALYQLVDYPRYREVPNDGIERAQTFDLPLVQSVTQAQRLAKQQFARNKYQGRFEAQLGARGWAVQLGDVVTLTFSTMGWASRLFRVVEHGIRPDGICPIVLQEEHADIYLWDHDERPVVAAVQPVPYDKTKSVLLQLLDAGELSYADGTSIEALKPGELGANVTSSHTAAAILGQGAFATVSSAAYGSPLLSGFGTLASLGNLYFGSPYLLEAFGGAGATLEAFKTLLGTAAAITGQTAWATFGTSTSVVQKFRSDGTLALGVNGGVATEGFGNWVTDASAITALGNAAGFAGQGALATLSSLALGGGYLSGFGGLAASSYVQFGSSTTVRTSDGTTVTDTTVVTAIGTAAAFTGQGGLATRNTVDTPRIDVGAVTAITAVDGGAVVANTSNPRSAPKTAASITLPTPSGQTVRVDTIFSAALDDGWPAEWYMRIVRIQSGVTTAVVDWMTPLAGIPLWYLDAPTAGVSAEYRIQIANEETGGHGNLTTYTNRLMVLDLKR